MEINEILEELEGKDKEEQITGLRIAVKFLIREIELLNGIKSAETKVKIPISTIEKKKTSFQFPTLPE